MSLDVFKACKTKFDSSASLTAGVGTLYIGMQPPAAVIPYARLTHIGDEMDESFGLLHIQQSTVSFSMFHESLSSLATLQTTLTALFDRCSMSLDNGTLLSCQRISEVLLTDPFPSESGKTVYMSVTDYRLKIDRTF